MNRTPALPPPTHRWRGLNALRLLQSSSLAVTLPLRLALSVTACLLLAMTLPSCGGGGGSATVASVPGSGGTGSYTVGPISGFGSVIINGIRFDDSSASVETEDGDSSDDDKGALDRNDLKLGMIAQVESGPIVAGSNGALSSSSATVIRYANMLRGPVNNITPTGLTLLSQTVVVNGATVLEGVTDLSTANSSNCPWAEVFAFYDSASKVYTATRVECLTTQPSSYRLFGPVGYLNDSTTTCTVNGLSVNYSNLGSQPSLKQGDTVRLWLDKTSNSSTAVANSLHPDAPPSLGDNSEAHLEGLITDFVSPTQFKVNGVSVTTNASTQIESGTLANGVRVQLEGTLSNGVLTAKEIEIRSNDDLDDEENELVGVVSNATGNSGGTFTLTTTGNRSFTVSYSSSDFETTQDRNAFANGKRVEVKGTLGSSGYTLDATLVKIDD